MQPLTVAHIDELLTFIPLLEEWHKPHPQRWGNYTPVYPDIIYKFYRLLMQPQWQDYEYEPRDVWEMMQDETAISQANLAEIKSMLTFCQHGERFADGHWSKMIEKGYIGAILTRLSELRQKMEYSTKQGE